MKVWVHIYVGPCTFLVMCVCTCIYMLLLCFFPSSLLSVGDHRLNTQKLSTRLFSHATTVRSASVLPVQISDIITQASFWSTHHPTPPPTVSCHRCFLPGCRCRCPVPCWHEWSIAIGRFLMIATNCFCVSIFLHERIVRFVARLSNAHYPLLACLLEGRLLVKIDCFQCPGFAAVNFHRSHEGLQRFCEERSPSTGC